MPSCRLLLALSLLAGCPARTPPDPPPADSAANSAGDSTPGGGERTPADSGPGVTGVGDAPPAPDDPDAPDEPGEPDASERPTAPRLAAPRADNQIADTLKPGGTAAPPRRPATGGCEGGARRTGETWKVDCNECSCGDDGQTTCTAMACGAPSR